MKESYLPNFAFSLHSTKNIIWNVDCDTFVHTLHNGKVVTHKSNDFDGDTYTQKSKSIFIFISEENVTLVDNIMNVIGC